MAASPTPARAAAYRAALALPAAVLLAAAHRPPLGGELILDAAAPYVDVRIDEAPMRLRVDLAQNGVVELGPAAAARLQARFGPGWDVAVGRTRLPGRIARARLRVGGATLPVQIASHDRAPSGTGDGVIGPEQLPYAVVRWLRAEAPPPNGTTMLAIESDDRTGLEAPIADGGGVRLRFALDQSRSTATAAAGSLLVRQWGGRIGGAPERVTLSFGLERPARPILFARPGLLAGFRFASLLVRTLDFGGDAPLPAEPVAADDIVVTRHLPRQRAWPAVTVGLDRLARCAEIVYARPARTLTLRCAFDAP